MAVETKTELIGALATGDFDAILGTRESDWLDFKQKPHDLATPKGRRDLVADCAMFANLRGGVILCGVKEELLEHLNAAVALEITSVKRGAVDEDRIRALIRANVRPLLQFELAWFVRDNEELFAIVIESQPDNLKPFIVNRLADEDDDRDLPNAVGWPIRHGTGTHWETIDRIQHLIADGVRHRLRSDSLSQGEPRDSNEVAKAHLKDVQEREAWQHWPLYAVSISPVVPPDERIDDFFGAFRTRVEGWKGLRANGFNLALDWGRAEVEAGEIRSIDERRAIYITRLGTVTAVASGSPDMLGWANHQAPHWRNVPSVIINPFVMVEFTLEAVRFAYKAVGPELSARTGWTAGVFGRRLKGEGEHPSLSLRTSIGRNAFLQQAIAPITDDFDAALNFHDEDPEEHTYRVLAEAMGVGWGLPHDRVPFAENGRILMDSITDASKKT